MNFQNKMILLSFHQHEQMMCALGQVDNDFPVWSLNAWSQIQSFPVPEFQASLKIFRKLGTTPS